VRDDEGFQGVSAITARTTPLLHIAAQKITLPDMKVAFTRSNLAMENYDAY